jgi:chitinase
VFKLADAQRLAQFSREVSLGRMFMWSANRDVECGPGIDDGRPSNTCSGVEQEPREFARVLGGPRNAQPKLILPSVARDETRGESLTRDDPRTSPYPLWRATRAYPEGSKVVWQGRVYEAKWWSERSQPDAPVKQAWETPWRYLGPVLATDVEAIRAAEPASGERPRWSAETVYIAGNEVTVGNEVFRAKWWTQGVLPEETPDQPYDHPWTYIGEVPKEEKAP